MQSQKGAKNALQSGMMAQGLADLCADEGRGIEVNIPKRTKNNVASKKHEFQARKNLIDSIAKQGAL